MTHGPTTGERALQDQIDRLSALVTSLQTDLATLREPPAAQPAVPPAADPAAGSGSRRHLLKVASCAAVAAVAAGVALDGAHPVAASTNDPLLVGRKNSAQNVTMLLPGNIPASPSDPLTLERALLWVDNRSSTLQDAVGIRGHGGDDGIGIDGHGGNTGVQGTGTTDGRGTGVSGLGDYGVIGSGITVGVVGIGNSPTAIGVGAVGNRTALALLPSAGTEPPSRSDEHTFGEIDVDSNGATWLCIATGTPGTWRLLGSPKASGAFHAIDPARVYDSRLGAYASSGALTPGSSRTVSVKDGHDAAGGLTAADVVPAGSTAVTFNITVSGPTGPNYVSVVPGDATGFTTSTINFPGGFDAANGSVVRLDAGRQIKLFAGDQSGSTHVIIDVTGYYR